jgi:hypothetical protein
LGDFTVAANTHVSGEYTLATNYDGTTSNLYVNGDLITQTTPSPAISAGVKEFILGKEFDGYVKNFKFWNYAKQLSSPSATGGTVTYITGYTVHTFTSSGDFIVTSGGEFEYLVVGGGGGGGTVYQAGGGGGGGMLSGTFASLPTGTYNIIVGAGGTAGSGGRSNITIAGDGGNSQFHTVQTLGGAYGPTLDGQWGRTGGSGGGNGGIGTTGQGFDGGDYNYPAGGGGGGAGGPGGDASDGNGGNGGVGRTWNGNGIKYAGGGGGGSWTGTLSTAYDGGGGGGRENGSTSGQSGTINTGGGGGGGTPGGAGGSGIVIIRYAS